MGSMPHCKLSQSTRSLHFFAQFLLPHTRALLVAGGTPQTRDPPSSQQALSPGPTHGLSATGTGEEKDQTARLSSTRAFRA